MEYQFLSKSDISALIAYLRSVPAIDQESPKISVGPMSKILYGLGELPNLVASNNFIDPTLDIPKPEEGNTAEFGKYIVNSSCAGCHRFDLSGGNIPGAPPDWPSAPPLNNLVAIGYTADKFSATLRGGVKPDGTNLKLPMAGSTARLMTDDELGAIWKYLESANSTINNKTTP
jgi:mono/diheme cytochrome c family protein